ncbi:MAG: sugar ABC transporter ATP-binding protein, partial [Tissierellia bacterium]|nr:sugar ABC transporter ATP-binding protein [Tissierellia bacterium]
MLGNVMQIDTPLNLYNKPKNKFVATFIGAPRMNIFETTLFMDKGKMALKIDENIIYLNEKMAKKVESH